MVRPDPLQLIRNAAHQSQVERHEQISPQLASSLDSPPEMEAQSDRQQIHRLQELQRDQGPWFRSETTPLAGDVMHQRSLPDQGEI